MFGGAISQVPGSLFPMNLALASVIIQWNRMSMTLVRLGLMVLLVTLSPVVASVQMGVWLGRVWPISVSAVMMGCPA